MWRSPAVSLIIGRLARVGAGRIPSLNSSYSTMVQSQLCNRNVAKPVSEFQEKLDHPASHQLSGQNAGVGVQRPQPGRNVSRRDKINFLLQTEKLDHPASHQLSGQNAGVGVQRPQPGRNVSRSDKINFLLQTLLDLKDNKEAVYGALDAWVAWEQSFPIASVKQVLIALEKEQQWHRMVQVIKWMLSKGQGNTRGTYGQLIRALDMDHRAEEAHGVWVKKIGTDLHSVPWQLCHCMLSIYHRNNMLERLVKLFKGLEAFDRKPPEKSIVQKVADAYEMLGMLEEKERILQKYNHLFNDAEEGPKKKFTHTSYKKKKKKSGSSGASGKSENASKVEASTDAAGGIE